jgi:hypothetical protein
VQPMLSRWGWVSGVHGASIAALLFGTFVHNAAHIVRVWLELQTREKFFEKVWRAVVKSALGALTDASGEFFDVIEDLTPFGHLGQDLSLRVHDGGVVTAERLADLG